MSFASNMKRIIPILIVAFGMGGCATLTKPGGLFYPSGQQLKLSKAMTLLQQGDSSTAAGLLNDISGEPAVPGVTDEALFLSAILRLGPDWGMNNIEQAQNDLERLVKGYPSSSWSPLASSLAVFLASVQEARKQEAALNESSFSLKQENKELTDLNLAMTKELTAVKDSNLSLTKENARLRDIIEKLKNQNLQLSDIIEQLKNLDLELGSKPHQ